MKQRQPSREERLQRPSLLGADLDRASLSGHFSVARAARPLPEGWEEHGQAGWRLHRERLLPVADLLDRDGIPIGWLLGHAIDLEARAVVAGSPRLPVSVGDRRSDEHLQEWLYRHAGRWAAIVLAPAPRIYPDPFASLTVLFDPATETVSSSPFLLPDGDGALTDSPLVGEVAVYRSGRYFPLGATSLAGARMLLPSHRLDLTTFADERVWPLAPPAPADPAYAAERVAQIVEATIAAVAATRDATMSLTAGGDSRMLLACARPVADQIRLYTLRIPDADGRTDARLAARIAGEQALAHELLPWVRPSDEDVRRWLLLTGALTGEPRGRRAGPTFALVGHGRLDLNGVGVELARGRKWWPADRATTRLTSADLCARLCLASHPLLLRLGDRWLAEIPDLNALDVIDLFFLEICHGGWAGPLTFAHPQAFAAILYPFAHREILDLVLGLPADYRRDDRLRTDVVASRWPELGGYPVNPVLRRYTAVDRAKRASQLPRGAVRRAARRWASAGDSRA